MKKLKRLVCALLAAITVFSVLPAGIISAHAAYQDPPIGAYYEDAVSWAKTNRILAGPSGAAFDPQKNITRSQMLKCIWILAGRDTRYIKEAAVFTDVPYNADYRAAVGWAVKYKITSGTTATTFSPEAAITSEQAIVFMYKAFPQISGVTRTNAGMLASSNCSSYADAAFAWANEQQYLAAIPNFTAMSKFEGSVKVTGGMALYLLWEMKTGEYLNSKVKNMVSTAVACDGDPSWFSGQWCDQFVGWCASKAHLAGGDSYPISESGAPEIMIPRLLDRKNIYMPNAILQGSKWSLWRKRVTGSRAELDAYDQNLKYLGFNLDDQAVEIGTQFQPHRGDIIFFQYGGYTVMNAGASGSEWFSHIGIITNAYAVNDKKVNIETIEGNMNNKVGTGTYQVNLVTGEIKKVNLATGETTEFDIKKYIFAFGRIS